MVSAAADGDEVHPITQFVCNLSYDSVIDDSKRKSVSVQKFNLEDLQIMEVYVLLNQMSEVAHRLWFINGEHKEKLKESVRCHRFDYTRGAHSYLQRWAKQQSQDRTFFVQCPRRWKGSQS